MEKSWKKSRDRDNRGRENENVEERSADRTNERREKCY